MSVMMDRSTCHVRMISGGATSVTNMRMRFCMWSTSLRPVTARPSVRTMQNVTSSLTPQNMVETVVYITSVTSLTMLTAMTMIV